MIKKQKDEIRAEYKLLRSEMSREEKAKRDEAICKVAEGLVSFKYAEYVLLYAAQENEIDLTALANVAFEKGKKVLFPRCDKKTHTMLQVLPIIPPTRKFLLPGQTTYPTHYASQMD